MNLSVLNVTKLTKIQNLNPSYTNTTAIEITTFSPPSLLMTQTVAFIPNFPPPHLWLALTRGGCRPQH